MTGFFWKLRVRVVEIGFRFAGSPLWIVRRVDRFGQPDDFPEVLAVLLGDLDVGLAAAALRVGRPETEKRVAFVGRNPSRSDKEYQNERCAQSSHLALLPQK